MIISIRRVATPMGPHEAQAKGGAGCRSGQQLETSRGALETGSAHDTPEAAKAPERPFGGISS
jgi:hypothetical protein